MGSPRPCPCPSATSSLPAGSSTPRTGPPSPTCRNVQSTSCGSLPPDESEFRGAGSVLGRNCLLGPHRRCGLNRTLTHNPYQHAFATSSIELYGRSLPRPRRLRQPPTVSANPQPDPHSAPTSKIVEWRDSIRLKRCLQCETGGETVDDQRANASCARVAIPTRKKMDHFCDIDRRDCPLPLAPPHRSRRFGQPRLQRVAGATD